MTDPIASGARIGFVGLGRMGTPMAVRLAEAGYLVTGYDNSPAAGAVLAAAPGASVVSTLAEVVEGADVVILMLPDSKIVEAVVLGGLDDLLPAGGLLVDMSSSHPDSTRKLAVHLAERDVTLLDAPVSGGVTGAVAGTLAVMVGGPADAFERLRPVFEVIGGRITLCGGVGAGDVVKALNNLMSASHLLASSEAILAGTAAGVDPTVLLEVVNGSSGRSGSTENKWPNFILTEGYNSGFGLRLMLKDMRIAQDLAKSHGIPSRLADTAVEAWADASEQLAPDADHTEIVRYLRSGITKPHHDTEEER